MSKLADEVNKLADKVGMRLLTCNLIGQNYQPWYNATKSPPVYMLIPIPNPGVK